MVRMRLRSRSNLMITLAQSKKTSRRLNALARFIFGRKGIRTPDLYSAIVALSQLSYTPSEQE
jgi:hypothetical protein